MEIPIDKIRIMKQQGLDNNQIIQTLQRSGYSSTQIFDAMNQVNLAGSGSSGMPASNSMMGGNLGMSSMVGSSPSPFNSSAMAGMNSPNLSGQSMQSSSSPSNVSLDASSEELIETIIDEKWNELVKDINKIIDWKAKTEQKITRIETQFNDLKDQFDKLHEAVIGKIGEYDKNILNVGAEIKAMEKVFANVLPVFIDNVNELSRITDNIKSNSNVNNNLGGNNNFDDM